MSKNISHYDTYSCGFPKGCFSQWLVFKNLVNRQRFVERQTQDLVCWTASNVRVISEYNIITSKIWGAGVEYSLGLRRFQNKSIVRFKKPDLTSGGKIFHTSEMKKIEKDRIEFNVRSTLAVNSILLLFTFVRPPKLLSQIYHPERKHSKEGRVIFSMFTLPLSNTRSEN